MLKKKVGCPFCNDEIVANAFLESEKFRVVYNLSPILPGHSMVIPKGHTESLMDLTDDELGEFVRLGRRAVEVLLRVFNASAFNWTIQEGESAGQTVSHLHLHLIPRASGDLPHPGDWYPRFLKWKDEAIDSQSRPKLSPQEIRHIIDRITKAL